MAGEYLFRAQGSPEDHKQIMLALGRYVGQYTVEHFDCAGTLILRNDSVTAAYEAIDFDAPTDDGKVSDEVVGILTEGAINPNLN